METLRIKIAEFATISFPVIITLIPRILLAAAYRKKKNSQQNIRNKSQAIIGNALGTMHGLFFRQKHYWQKE